MFSPKNSSRRAMGGRGLGVVGGHSNSKIMTHFLISYIKEVRVLKACKINACWGGGKHQHRYHNDGYIRMHMLVSNPTSGELVAVTQRCPYDLIRSSTYASLHNWGLCCIVTAI